MANINGFQIKITAFLPATGGIDDQMRALSMVKDAQENGNYADLLANAQIDVLKIDQKTRRVKDAPADAPEADEGHGEEDMDEPTEA